MEVKYLLYFFDSVSLKIRKRSLVYIGHHHDLKLESFRTRSLVWERVKDNGTLVHITVPL